MTSKVTTSITEFKVVPSAGQVVSLFLTLISSPIFVVNGTLAILTGKPVFQRQSRTDCFGRSYLCHSFSSGIFKSCAIFLDVLSGKLTFIGLPTLNVIDGKHEEQAIGLYRKTLGLFHCLYPSYCSGLVYEKPFAKLKNQFSLSTHKTCGIVVSNIFAHIFYGNKTNNLQEPAVFKLFGLPIHNVSMQNAVDWCLQNKTINGPCRTGVFVNVNSVNTAAKNDSLHHAINSADRSFADGSGVRIAAKHGGIKVRENVNGTDLLPLLCQQASDKGKSLYLLGGEPGVAEQAVQKLTSDFPSLRITGHRHGYFSDENTAQIVAEINASNADIVLVAMGSPKQEQWLVEQAHLLNCSVGLAVGGLFDFVSGKFTRAPLFFRELGLEWIWRLFEDPKTKFSRYVLGNPLFLFRTFIQNQANIEVVS